MSRPFWIKQTGMTLGICILPRWMISDRTFILWSLNPLILLEYGPFRTCSSIWNTSSSPKSSIWRDHFDERFLRYFYQKVFQKGAELEICRIIYKFLMDSIIYEIPTQNTVFEPFYIFRWFVTKSTLWQFARNPAKSCTSSFLKRDPSPRFVIH